MAYTDVYYTSISTAYAVSSNYDLKCLMRLQIIIIDNLRHRMLILVVIETPYNVSDIIKYLADKDLLDI